MKSRCVKAEAQTARHARLRLFGLIVAFVIAAGCAQLEASRFAAAAPAPGTHSVFVVGYTYHAGILVRTRDVPHGAWPVQRDFPQVEYLELGWGDREYYPRDDPGVLLALRALLVPTRSTVNVIGVNDPRDRARLGAEVIELHVPAAGFAHLVTFVGETFERDAEGHPIAIARGRLQEGRFYASPRTFHALENCNTWVARALAAAGVPVEAEGTVTAGALLRQVRRLVGGQPE